MKSFEFPKSSQQQETLFQSTYKFLQFVEAYYNQQIQQTSRKVTVGDKTRHSILSNFKDTPDWKRLAMSKEEKKKEKADVAPSLENKILQAIGNAEKFLQQTDEDLKAKKSGIPKPASSSTATTKPETPATTDHLKRTESVGTKGKKPEPVKGPVAAGKQPIGAKGRTSSLKPGERSRDVKKPGQIGQPPLKSGTGMTGSNKNLAVGKKEVDVPRMVGRAATETNIVQKNVIGGNRVVENVEEDRKEEEKVSDWIARSQKGEEKKVDEDGNGNGVRVCRFGTMETEVVNKGHIKDYIEAKKSLKKKCENLKSNVNYYQEREKKAKNRFMMKLTGHLRCIEDIVRREHYEAEHGGDNHEDEEEVKRAEFCELAYEDEDFPVINSEVEETLQVAPQIIESLKAQMNMNNEDFRHIVEARSVFDDDDNNPDIVDRLLQGFKSRYLLDMIKEKRKFLKEVVRPMLRSPDIEHAVDAADRVWSGINYFVPIERNMETTAEKGLKQITWMTWAFSDKPNKSEILSKKSNVQGQKSLLRDEVEGEGVLEMEYLSFESALLAALLSYITEKYPVSANSRSIPNVKGANLGEFLKLMRMMWIFTKGDCRTFPLYMVQTEC